MLPYSTPKDYTPLAVGADPTVKHHQAMLASLEATAQAFDAEVAHTQQLVASAAISRPPWWEAPAPTPQAVPATPPGAAHAPTCRHEHHLPTPCRVGAFAFMSGFDK